MKNLAYRLSFLISYFLIWIAYFVFARLFFLLFYVSETLKLDFITILKTFGYGLRLDASFTSYLSIIPFFLVVISILTSPLQIRNIIKWYSYLVITIITLFLIIDASLYAAWGVRLDTTFLSYLNTPEVMIASASNFQIVSGLILWFLISFAFIKLFQKTINKTFKTFNTENRIQIPLFLLLTASLIIPLRGGLQEIPVNQSNVYFSKKMFANHAAINFIWNFSNTVTHKTSNINIYKQFDEEVAVSIINKTKNQLLKSDRDSILNIKNPNVILIIWESLTAKVVGALNGETTVTENLNRLSKEGIWFTNFYGNGDRTDKGIPAILSGYYPQPIKKIMRMPNKSRSLPMLPKEMSALGYNTSFYYGGDLNFGNLNTYLRIAEIDKIVDGSEFDKKDWNSKWGAFDNVFLERFGNDLAKKQEKPFFAIALTSTSHEPFELNDTYKFGKKNQDDLFRSSHAYTDKYISKFIDFAKKQDWYKETLIVIMADHGHSSPKHEGEYFSPKKFQIPMLWLGGALHQKGINIDNITSQVDFSYTLLDLLKGNNSEFKFGKNLFNNSDKQYAHYVFNKGFGTINKDGFYLYDYVSKKPITKYGKTSANLDSLGKALTQDSYQDFLERK